MKDVVFLGSKPIGYECLNWLVDKAIALNVRIIGILTRERKEFEGENDLRQLAEKNGIAVYDSPDEIPDCDIMYSVQYHNILKAHHIAKARMFAVNLHMAPLPEYRGSNQFSFAILEEKEEFGTTIHLIDTGIDSGDIIFQKRFQIPVNCWVNDLYELTRRASFNLFKQTAAHLFTGNFTTVSQASLVPKYGTALHYRKEMAEIKKIDLNWNADKIERYIRATSMPGFEPPYFILDGMKIYLTDKY